MSVVVITLPAKLLSYLLKASEKKITHNGKVVIDNLNSLELDKVSKIIIKDKEIEYIYFNLNHENLSNDSEEEMKVLIYEYEDEIKINAFKGNQNAGRMLKYYFNDEDKWGTIVEDRHNVSEDLLYWVFKCLIDTPGALLYNTNQLYVNYVNRYSGKTKDQNNTMIGKGDRISDILGTLAFLLDNDVKMVRVKVTDIFNISKSEFHSVLIDIRLTGTIKFDRSSYTGTFNFEDDLEKLVIAISIYCSTEILPKIVESYEKSIEENIWSQSIKKEFIRRIGLQIKDRVDSELKKLSKINNQISLGDVLINEEDEYEDEIALDSAERVA